MPLSGVGKTQAGLGCVSKRSSMSKALLPTRGGTLLNLAPAIRRTRVAAFNETVNSGVDTAAADLILRSAAAHGLSQSAADGEAIISLFHSMNHAIGSSSLLHPHSSVMDGITAFSDLSYVHTHASMLDAASVPMSHVTASLPMDPLHIDPDLADAGSQSLSEIASSAASMSAAATDSVSLAAASVEHTLSGIADWARGRLEVVAALDPQSYTSMSGSLNEVVDGLKSMLESDSAIVASQYTSALVLGVQQLVAGLDLSEGPGGSSIESMMAAQVAMADAIKKSSSENTLLIQMSLAAIALLVAAVPRDAPSAKAAAASSTSSNPADEVPLRYSPDDLAVYFSRRPVIVLQRNAHVAKYFCTFVGSLMLDARTGNWEKNMASRAKWLREIAEQLGPTYIKFVQAASTRVDMLPVEYLDEFSKLQDNVPTFSTMEARVVLEEGLGTNVENVFEWISEEPVAAASLGQVYRGQLRSEYGGSEVAIKVQRPGVLESASLDIFVMRRACQLLAQVPGMSDQWACALDDWAYRFFQEMDYQLEAFNTMTFARDMSHLKGVMVASVHPELTSRKIIVTDWINAVRLSNSDTRDVKALCSTLLNCYLIQLLETGLLHADPHPGNLMLTEDGRIVILDFGLVTEVHEDQRVALVEFISHLMLENWDDAANDLVALGFMPEGLPPGVDAREIAPIVKKVLGQIVAGGGIRGGINIMDIISSGDMEGLAMQYKVCIPPYFALVVRAFAVIEGIALKADPDYAIVHECLPYLSRRLLTDNNPRMRAALKQMLYGDSSRLDVNRLHRLLGAFSNFTTGSQTGAEAHDRGGVPVQTALFSSKGPIPSSSTHALASASGPASENVSSRASYSQALLGGAADEGPVLNDAARECLKVVFAKDGSYAQELLVEELVAATDAMSREALSEALRMVMSSAALVSTLRSVEALGPLRAMLLPIPLPMEMMSGFGRSSHQAFALTNEDRQALSTLRAILDLLQPSVAQMPGAVSSSGRMIKAAGEVMPLLPELMPGVKVTIELFIRQLVRRMALRLAEDLGPISPTQPSPVPVSSNSSGSSGGSGPGAHQPHSSSSGGR